MMDCKILSMPYSKFYGRGWSVPYSSNVYNFYISIIKAQYLFSITGPLLLILNTINVASFVMETILWLLHKPLKVRN